MEEPAVETDDFVVDLAARQVRNADGEVRVTPTEWHVLETLARRAAPAGVGTRVLTLTRGQPRKLIA